VPFRSTLKKLQARWSGDMPFGVGGQPKLVAKPKEAFDLISGTLVNQTGAELRNIYIAFHDPRQGDWMLYVPQWTSSGKDSTIDLGDLFLHAAMLPLPGQEKQE